MTTGIIAALACIAIGTTGLVLLLQRDLARAERRTRWAQAQVRWGTVSVRLTAHTEAIAQALREVGVSAQQAAEAMRRFGTAVSYVGKHRA